VADREPTQALPATQLASGAYGIFEGDASDEVVFGTYRTTGAWSPLLVTLLCEHLLRRGPGTLLDVGANIGLVTIPVVERTFAVAVAFEPEPGNHGLLTRNILRHGLRDRVETHALALAAQAGRATLAMCEYNSGDHRLVFESEPAPRRLLSVEVATLDAVLAGRALERPVVMKIDTQGAEVRVLLGAEKTLHDVDYLVVEYWPAGLLRMGNTAEQLQALLLRFPYGAFLNQDMLPDRLVPSAALLSALSWIATDGSDEGFVDLLFAKCAELY
jgi:FkbM family methyltransferase